MNALEDRLTSALDQRGAAVNVNDRLDDIVDKTTGIVRLDDPPTRRNWRLLSAAAAGVLLVVGALAVARYASPGSEDGNSTRPDGPAALPVPLSFVTRLADDDWVLPTRVPDGYEFQYAASTSDDTRPSQTILFGVGTSLTEQIVVNRHPQGSNTPGEPVDVDGTEWALSGTEGFRVATRRVGDDQISIEGFPGSDAELAAMLDDLVVVTDAGLPHAPIAFGESMTEVARFDIDGRELTVRADGSNGWLCDGVFEVGAGSNGRCAPSFDPTRHLQEDHSGAASSSDGSTDILARTYGLTSTAAARIEVEWIDGTVTTVTPRNTSDRFAEVQFWATGATLELDGQSPDTSTVAAVRAYDADGDLLATSRNGVLTVE